MFHGGTNEHSGELPMKMDKLIQQRLSELAAYDCPGRVMGGTVSPRWIRFRVIPLPGRGGRMKALGEVLAEALDALAPRLMGRLLTGIYHHDGRESRYDSTKNNQKPAPN